MSKQSKKEMFHSHESDALRVIKAAQQNAEAKDKPELDVIKQAPDFLVKKRPGRPRKDAKEKSNRTKRATLYLSPEEHEFFRQQAFAKHFAISETILTAALEHLGYVPEAQK